MLFHEEKEEKKKISSVPLGIRKTLIANLGLLSGFHNPHHRSLDQDLSLFDNSRHRIVGIRTLLSTFSLSFDANVDIDLHSTLGTLEEFIQREGVSWLDRCFFVGDLGFHIQDLRFQQSTKGVDEYIVSKLRGNLEKGFRHYSISC